MNEEKKNRQLPKKSKFNKGFFIGLGITLFVLAVVAVAIFLFEYFTPDIRTFFDENGNRVLTQLNFLNMMSDIFIIPSILAILVYALMFVSKEGAFDAITYSVKLVFYSIFAKNMRHTKLPATYGEYRAMKMAQERSSSLFLLFAAIPYLITGLVFTILAVI